MIKIHNYFFEKEHITEFSPEKVRQGETRRSLNGKAHNIVIGDNDGYWVFNIELDGLSTNQLYFIYEIEEYLRNSEEDEPTIELVTPWGESFDVIIPLPLDDYIDVSGENDYYNVALELQERG